MPSELVGTAGFEPTTPRPPGNTLRLPTTVDTRPCSAHKGRWRTWTYATVRNDSHSVGHSTVHNGRAMPRSTRAGTQTLTPTTNVAQILALRRSQRAGWLITGAVRAGPTVSAGMWTPGRRRPERVPGMRH